MAIVSLVALLAALGIAALISLSPWATSTVAPHLDLSPDLGVALDDSVAVARAPDVRLAEARIVPARRPHLASTHVEASGEGQGSARGPSIAPARPLPTGSGGSPGGRSEPPPPAPETPPAAAPVALPVAAPTPPAPAPAPAATPIRPVGPGGGPPGPVGAGTGGGVSSAGPFLAQEGDEYALSFLLSTDGTAFGALGVENAILRFSGAIGLPASFGLQLWDDGSGAARGLWSAGDAMGGERFLAPLADGEWHQVAVYFRASSQADGFYVLFVDGEPVDFRSEVSLIEPGGSHAQIDVGLYRGGERVVGLPGLRFDALELSETLELAPALP